MKDIDFDELDRAVSSVLETPADEATPAAATTPVDTPKPKEPEAETDTAPEPAASDTESTSEPTETETPVAKTPLAIKRRGQFMDVVHPSSDMTSKSGETPVAAPKVVLKPISATVEPEADAASEITPAEETTTTEETPVVDAAPTEAIDTPPVERIWPDPIDTMEQQEAAKDAPATEMTGVEDKAVEANDIEADTNTETDQPEDTQTTEEEAAPTTPFIAEAKVEKRPLDAFSTEEAPTESAAAPTEPLPPELHPDVMAVEANPSDSATEEEKEPAIAEKQSTPEPSFNASIPQQYVAAENQAEEDHSIFDTKEYHQPLAPAKTKKRGLPGWLVAVLVILLLAGIGAAGGYFWFYYGF